MPFINENETSDEIKKKKCRKAICFYLSWATLIVLRENLSANFLPNFADLMVHRWTHKFATKFVEISDRFRFLLPRKNHFLASN